VKLNLRSEITTRRKNLNKRRNFIMKIWTGKRSWGKIGVFIRKLEEQLEEK
jgi:hypothetical protein